MVKPELPVEVASLFPHMIVRKINSYIPKNKKKLASQSLQYHLEKLQKSPKRTAMYLYGLDDFVLC